MTEDNPNPTELLRSLATDFDDVKSPPSMGLVARVLAAQASLMDTMIDLAKLTAGNPDDPEAAIDRLNESFRSTLQLIAEALDQIHSESEGEHRD